MPAMKGDIYEVYVPWLLLLMLCISSMTVMPGDDEKLRRRVMP